MFEHLLQDLPESALACRALYDVDTGGYHLPQRRDNRLLTRDAVAGLRAAGGPLMFDCVEVPVADLLYTLVVNTRSRHVLETGTSRGFSSCHLAAGARFVAGDEARVLTIDPDPAPHPFFEDSALARSIRPLRASALDVDPEPALDRAFGAGSVDFMFFDSLHTYDHLSKELVRWLPRLRLGGLFALHDTFVYDDLGLVVLALAAQPQVEALSLPSHRRHPEPGRRPPGVSLFRKVAPIGDGDLRFPDLAGVLKGERECLADPAAVAARTGALFADPRYHASAMQRGGARRPDQPALLEPRPPPSSAAPEGPAARIGQRLLRALSRPR